ncbi:hypothetical protein B566_EDAN009048 [Ephemera danica]|nr:hypothetical protein B566_EDAN009048 [Ephemera danica]
MNELCVTQTEYAAVIKQMNHNNCDAFLADVWKLTFSRYLERMKPKSTKGITSWVQLPEAAESHCAPHTFGCDQFEWEDHGVGQVTSADAIVLIWLYIIPVKASKLASIDPITPDGTSYKISLQSSQLLCSKSVASCICTNIVLAGECDEPITARVIAAHRTTVGNVWSMSFTVETGRPPGGIHDFTQPLYTSRSCWNKGGGSSTNECKPKLAFYTGNQWNGEDQSSASSLRKYCTTFGNLKTYNYKMLLPYADYVVNCAGYLSDQVRRVSLDLFSSRTFSSGVVITCEWSAPRPLLITSFLGRIHNAVLPTHYRIFSRQKHLAIAWDKMKSLKHNRILKQRDRCPLLQRKSVKRTPQRDRCLATCSALSIFHHILALRRLNNFKRNAVVVQKAPPGEKTLGKGSNSVINRKQKEDLISIDNKAVIGQDNSENESYFEVSRLGENSAMKVLRKPGHVLILWFTLNSSSYHVDTAPSRHDGIHLAKASSNPIAETPMTAFSNLSKNTVVVISIKLRMSQFVCKSKILRKEEAAAKFCLEQLVAGQHNSTQGRSGGQVLLRAASSRPARN